MIGREIQWSRGNFDTFCLRKPQWGKAGRDSELQLETCVFHQTEAQKKKEYNVQNQSKNLLFSKKRPPLLVVENDFYIRILALYVLFRRKRRGWLLQLPLHINPSPPNVIPDLSTPALSTESARLFLEAKRQWEGE